MGLIRYLSFYVVCNRAIGFHMVSQWLLSLQHKLWPCDLVMEMKSLWLAAYLYNTDCCFFFFPCSILVSCVVIHSEFLYCLLSQIKFHIYHMDALSPYFVPTFLASDSFLFSNCTGLSLIFEFPVCYMGLLMSSFKCACLCLDQNINQPHCSVICVKSLDCFQICSLLNLEGYISYLPCLNPWGTRRVVLIHGYFISSICFDLYSFICSMCFFC